MHLFLSQFYIVDLGLDLISTKENEYNKKHLSFYNPRRGGETHGNGD